jgi:hypothetical protein
VAKWRLQHLDAEATQELRTYFADDDVQAEIKRILKILTDQDDPRKPSKSSGLIVDRIEFDAPNWFRVKVPRYALRIIFRLLVVRDDKVVELYPDELSSDDEERYIDITRIGRHPTIYGKGLRERYKKLGDN